MEGYIMESDSKAGVVFWDYILKCDSFLEDVRLVV